jgi:hypothetical protein
MAGPKDWVKFDRPRARPRLSGGEVLYRILMLSGVMGPPPMPWRGRKRISDCTFQASPPSAEPVMKRSVERMNKRFVPTRAPSQPTAGIMTAWMIWKEVCTH